MLWIALVLLALLAPDPSPGSSCAPGSIALRGDAVAQARERLMALQLNDGQTELDQEAQSDVEGLKDRLGEFVVATVTCGDAREAPEAIARRLRTGSRATPDTRDFNDPASWRWMHGAGLDYDVAAPEGHPELLAVVARFGVNCGQDAVFILFERRRGAARPLMIRRSAPYDEVSGAWEDLRYAVAPADASGRWYVALAHIPSWCQSNWRSLFYDLSRPAGEPASPKIFFSRRVPTFIGNDVNAVLRAEPERFQVEHDGGIRGDGIVLRRHVETYSVSGDRVARIQPAAFNVRDFADEWIGASWDEARRWSARALESPHRAIGADLAARAYGAFGAIRRCRSGGHSVTLQRFARRGGVEDGAWYFTVLGDGPYRMVHAGRRPASGCEGPDLSEAIETESRRRMGTGD